jgi:hypothetical protein
MVIAFDRNIAPPLQMMHLFPFWRRALSGFIWISNLDILIPSLRFHGYGFERCWLGRSLFVLGELLDRIAFLVGTIPFGLHVFSPWLLRGA